MDFLEQFFNISPNLLCIADHNGRFIRVNQEWARVLGYQIEDLEAHSYLDFVHPEDQAKTLEAIACLASQQTVQGFQNRYRTRQGDYRILEWRSMPSGDLIYAVAHDVTEREAHEALLRKSQMEYQSTLNHLIVGVVVHAPDTRVILANPAACEILGMELDQIMGRKVMDPAWHFVKEDGSVATVEEYPAERVLQTLEPIVGLVFGIVGADPQKVTWVNINASPVLGESGELEKIVVNFVDITARREAERLLEVAKISIDSISDAMFWCSSEAQIEFVNQAACRMLGYSKNELEQMTVFDVDKNFPEAEWPRFWTRLEKEKCVRLETVHTRRDGSTFPVELTSNWILIGGHPYNCGVARDVSERKRIEAELQESEQMFRALFEKGPIGVAYHQMIYNDQGKPVDYRFLAANASYKELTGVDPTGRLATEAFPGIEKDPFHWIEVFGDVATTGREIRLQQHLVSNDRWYDCVGYQSKPGHFVAAFMEITDRKRAETLLEAKNHELEQILYVAAHDLRSPLVNINGYAQEIAETWEPMLKELKNRSEPASASMSTFTHRLEESMMDLELVRQSGKQLDRLLSGLLKVSRLGRSSIERVVIDMDLLMNRVRSGFDFQIKSIEGSLDVQPLPTCWSDPLLVTQVMTNLIDNAIKYRSPERPLNIQVRGWLCDGMVEYCVEDNGMGIKQEHQGKVFELFYRLNPSKTDGEGLGLTIIKQVLERLNGSVRVESVDGEGSCFYVTLPMPPMAKG